MTKARGTPEKEAPPHLGFTVEADQLDDDDLWLPGVVMPSYAEQQRYSRADRWTVVRTVDQQRAARGGRGKTTTKHTLAPVGVWLAAGTRIGEPYPCRCDLTGRPSCTSRRCPCWGSAPRPDVTGCCSNSPRNPRPRPLVEPTGDVVTLRPSGVGPELPGQVVRIGEARPMLPEIIATDDDHPPLARLFPPDTCTCPCQTPWDGDKRAKGRHCIDCHENFASSSAFEMHKRWMLSPCRRPQEIMDVDTGALLLGQLRERGFRVWRIAQSSPARVGKRPQ